MGTGTIAAFLDVAVAPCVVYATILILLTVDAFIPVVPTQALMIGGGILAASGEVHLVSVVAAGAIGALVGDLSCFQLGRHFAARDRRAGRSADRRPRGGRLGRLLSDRMSESLRRHAFLAVLACRFIPAGRMMTAVYAGRSGYARSRFATYDLLAVTLWATYGALLGHFGGRALISSSWLPLTAIAIAGALFVGAAPLSTAVGRLRHRTH